MMGQLLKREIGLISLLACLIWGGTGVAWANLITKTPGDRELSVDTLVNIDRSLKEMVGDKYIGMAVDYTFHEVQRLVGNLSRTLHELGGGFPNQIPHLGPDLGEINLPSKTNKTVTSLGWEEPGFFSHEDFTLQSLGMSPGSLAAVINAGTPSGLEEHFTLVINQGRKSDEDALGVVPAEKEPFDVTHGRVEEPPLIRTNSDEYISGLGTTVLLLASIWGLAIHIKFKSRKSILSPYIVFCPVTDKFTAISPENISGH